MNDEKTIKAGHDALPIIQPASSNQVKKKQKIEPAGTIVKVFVVLVFLLCGAGIVLDLSLKQGFDPVKAVVWMAGGFILSCLVGGIPAFIVFLCTKPKQDPALWTYCGVAGVLALMFLFSSVMQIAGVIPRTQIQAPNTMVQSETQQGLEEIDQRRKNLLDKELQGEVNIEASAALVEDATNILEKSGEKYAVEIAQALREDNNTNIAYARKYAETVNKVYATGWPRFESLENNKKSLNDLYGLLQLAKKQGDAFADHAFNHGKIIEDSLIAQGVPIADAKKIGSIAHNHPNNEAIRKIRRNDQAIVNNWLKLLRILRAEYGHWTVDDEGKVIFENKEVAKPFYYAYEEAVREALEQRKTQQNLANGS